MEAVLLATAVVTAYANVGYSLAPSQLLHVPLQHRHHPTYRV